MLAAPGAAQAAAAAESVVPDAALVAAFIVLGLLGFGLAVHWRAARAARFEARRLEAMLLSAPLAHVCWEAESGLEYISPAVSGIWRVGCNDFGDMLAEVAGGDRDRLATIVRNLRETGAVFMVTIETRGHRGIEVTGTEVTNAAGSVVAHALWLRDVTDIQSQAEAFRKASTEAVKKSRQLEAVINALPFPVWRRDQDFSLAWVNEAYARIVDGSAGKVADGQGVELLEGAAKWAQPKAPKEPAAEGEITHEHSHLVVDGERRAFELSHVPMAEGLGVAGYGLDETRLEGAQAEIRQLSEYHTDTLERLNTACAIFGPDKNLKFFNAAYAALWKMDEDWLNTDPHHGDVIEAMRESRRLPEQADFPAWKKSRLALHTNVIEPEAEYWHLPDGSTLRVVVQPHPQGGLQIFYEDVSYRVDMERSLNTLIAVQGETLANLYEAVVVVGSDGLLKLHNPAFARIWNLTPDDLAGEPHLSDIVERCRGLFHETDDWPGLKARIVGSAMEREAGSGRMERPDGVVLDYAVVPLPDGAVLMTYFDVTDSSRIERALRERAEAYETADRLKTEFIANMSYELRTPLNSIIGFGEILNGQYFGDLNDRQKEYSSGILESSQQLLALVNDILDLASMEAGVIALDIEEFDFHATLVSVLNMTKERARKQDINLHFDCPPDIGRIAADEQRIKQVAFNLLSNALKFSPAGSTVELGAARDDGWIRFWVADQGIGIKESDQEIVFERFETGSVDRARTGAGLGLSLVRNFMELHGGRVELQSEPGKGTRITCHLPERPEAGHGDAADNLKSAHN